MKQAMRRDWRSLGEGGGLSRPTTRPPIRTTFMDPVEFAALVIEHGEHGAQTGQAPESSSLVVLERILPLDLPRAPSQDRHRASETDRREFVTRLTVLGSASRTGPGQYALLLRGVSPDEAERMAADIAAEERNAFGSVFQILISPVGAGEDSPGGRTVQGRGLMRRTPLILGARVLPLEELMARLLKPMPAWKRLADVCASALGLAALAPLFLVIALYIRLASPGPVFFRQKRVGFCGRSFSIWKFRTMPHNADVSGHRSHLATLIKDETRPMVKIDRESKIIPGGRLLRKSCLDELPQLINVLMGDMSLVGPRPPIPYEVAEYAPRHWGRFAAVPGMTGLWQVSGKNRLSFSEMIDLDIDYARNKSPALDAYILAMTPATVAAQALLA